MSVSSIKQVSGSSPSPTDPFDELLKEMEELQEQIQQMEKNGQNLDDELQQLYDLQNQLTQELESLESIPNPTDAQKEEIANLKSQLKSTDQQIDAKKQQIANNDKQLEDAQSKLKSLTGSMATMQNVGNVGSNIVKLSQQSANKNFADGLAVDKEELAEQQRQDTFDAIEAYSKLSVLLGEDAIERLDNIKKDQEKIDDLNNQIKNLNYKISYLQYLWNDDHVVNKRDEKKAERDETRKDLKVQKAALKSDLEQLSALNTGQLKSLIDDLSKEVQTLLSLITQSGGGEGALQQASELLAQVMSILQMINTKVQQMRSDNQQWTSRANAAGNEIASHKSQSDYKAMTQLKKFQSELNDILKGTQIAMSVVCGLTAMVTGGASAIALTLVMGALTVSNGFSIMTKALTKLIDDKAPIWLQTCVDLVVTVALVAATRQLGNVISLARGAMQGAEAGAAAAAGEVVEQEFAAAAQQLEVQMGAVLNTMSKTWDAMVKTCDAMIAATKYMASAISSNFAMYVGILASGNGVSDVIETAYARITQGDDGWKKSKKKLEEQDTFKWVSLISSIVQAIVAMAATNSALKSNEQSVFGAITGNYLNLPMMQTASDIMQVISAIIMTQANVLLAQNSSRQAQLTKDLGEAEANMLVFKTLGQTLKLYENKQIELFASKLQQEVEALHTMINKNGQAEMEAARMLQESAV